VRGGAAQVKCGPAIVEVLKAHDIRRRDPRYPVWTLKDPFLPWPFSRGKVVETCKREILRVVATSGEPVVILHPDDPVEYDVPGSWEPLKEHCHRPFRPLIRARSDDLLEGETYRLPSDLDVDDYRTSCWLGLGNWCMYPGESPLVMDHEDLVRSKPAEVVEFLNEHNLGFYIDSFHDSDPWVVGIAGLPESAKDLPANGEG